MRRFQRKLVLLVTAPAMLIGCGNNGVSPPSTSATTGSTATQALTPTQTLDGRFPVGSDKTQLAIRCWGQGSPVVIFDGGHRGGAGISSWQGSRIVLDLQRRTRVCTYDRAGTGTSDPAPGHPRLLDDVTADLHDLLGAADVHPPYLMVGSSGGGFNVYHYAGRYPAEVVGLVLLDVPAGQATMSPSDVEELAWDNPGNPEHVDYVPVERQMALHRLPIPPIPVTVVTGKYGQSSDPQEQRVWLTGSSHPVQVVLDGGHNIYVDDPSGVLAEIQKVLELASAR